jgi:diguanylate cyclase (GGDEF)-like protein/PAS domain S-box-containing protein
MAKSTAEPRPSHVGEEVIDTLMSSDVSLGQIVKPFILECPPDLPLHEAALRMSEARVSSILVVDNDAVLGIWTERDALAVDFRDPTTFTRPVREVMSAPVRTVSAQLSLQALAVKFREEHVRHYLVVDADGRRCGVVSQTDVVLNQGIEHYLRLRRVDSVVRGRLQALPETATLAEAATLMRQAAVDAVVVSYTDGSWGILTERDVVRLVARQCGDETVGVLASHPLRTVDQRTSLYRVRALLTESRLRHIGVVRDDGTLADVVSFSDILSGMELVYVQELQHALRERDEALNISQRNLHLAEKVIESSLEGIMVTDDKSIIVSVNPAFTRLTGYSAEEVVGKTPAVLSSGRHDKSFYDVMWRRLRDYGHWQGEVWNRRKSGETYPELLTIAAITDRDGKLTHYAALFSDITELKESEERIRHLAYYDALTGLPNRRLLEDRLRVALAHAHRNRRQLAVLFIDLDRFKRINDTLGHEIGDRLLVAIAERLRDGVREDDTVARMGGDEFVALLSDIDNPDHAVQIARRLIEALKRPVQVDEHELVVTSSIGISIYPDDCDSAPALVKNADIAMYRAKDTGRNSFQLYAPAMNARSLEHLALESALHRALERGEFEMYYQPLLEAVSCRVVAAEALLRWHHPDLGLVPPADFIPLAEETGLIIPIGAWVLRDACRQLAQWRQRGFSELRVSVNISARQFHQPDFIVRAGQIVQEAGISPRQITLELTESMLMDDALETSRMLAQLHELGFGIAMDDFGTGYSSLSYLKRFPLNELKIDRVFIRDIERSPEDAAIVSATIGLAHSLGLRVVAEGVETAPQLAFLQQQRCDYVQGFHFSAPVAVDEFEKLL